VLGHHWEPGEATVVTSRAAPGPAGSVAYREYIIDVRPAGGSAPFRTKLGVSYSGRGEATDSRRRFKDGDVFPVLCDGKREKAKWDYDDPQIYKPGQSPQDRKENKRNPSEFDVAAAAPAGTAIHSGAGSDAGSGTPLADIAETSADFAAEAAAFAERSAAFRARAEASREALGAIARARQAGDFAEVERLKAQFANSTGESRLPTPDRRLERLQKLADLHDRGVLSDAEFATEKTQILGS
jgi:hypothetical protein